MPVSGKQELDRGEDPVVAAAGTPANLLVRLEVLAGELDAALAVAVGAVAVPLPSLTRPSTPGSWLDLGRPERAALHLGEALRVDEELRPHQLRELTEIQLGHEHLS